MTGYDDLERAAAGKAPAPTYGLGQVTVVNTALSPPTLTVDEGEFAREMIFQGLVSDYEPGDTVAYVERPGAPLVTGKVARKGSGDPLDPDDTELEDWHVVGAAGEVPFEFFWANWGAPFADAGFYRDPNYWVRLQGVVKDGFDTSTIFTLPAGYRPPFTCYFTVSTNNQNGYLRVGTDGQVTKISGGSNIYIALDGITFPTLTNAAGWTPPAMQPGWVYDSGLLSPAPLVYVRDDGWCWCRGSVNGTGNGEIANLPEDSRPYEYSEMLTTRGPSNTSGRLDCQYRGLLYNSSGNSGTFILSGANWWGIRSVGLPFTNMSLLNGWVPHEAATFAQPQYYRDHLGVVHLRGLANQDAKTGNTFATLPAGYRPAANHVAPTLTGSGGGTIGRFDIASNGNLTLVTGAGTGYVNLTGVSYRAEA